MPDITHPDPTRKSGFRYLFTGKHHGGGTSDDACWSPAITRGEEFSVFDAADFCDILDEDGRYYGVLRGVNGDLRDLGTWQQQVAEFPLAADGTAWHGYPILWAANDLAPPNRGSHKSRPSKGVFIRMEAANMITLRERKRLYKGDHA